ncbi:MAG: AtpZ/AtpI family protein [Chthoniobacterales bacterium]
MNEDRSTKGPSSFSREVGVKETRKLRARRRGTESVWFGFGMFGLVGWSVTVPTFLGAMLGLWLDKHYPGQHSWTLTLLIVGLTIGCLNAWHWVSRENNAMRDESENKNE